MTFTTCIRVCKRKYVDENADAVPAFDRVSCSCTNRLRPCAHRCRCVVAYMHATLANALVSLFAYAQILTCSHRAHIRALQTCCVCARSRMCVCVCSSAWAYGHSFAYAHACARSHVPAGASACAGACVLRWRTCMQDHVHLQICICA